MNSPSLFSKVNYRFLYFCVFADLEKNSKYLAAFVSSLTDPDKNLLGFDRLLWSCLSSGQMPSQLYSFNFYGSRSGCKIEEGVLIIFSTDELSSFPEFAKVERIVLETVAKDKGEMLDSYEEDTEFENCFYASLLIWKNFTGEPVVLNGVQNIWFGDSVQLIAGKSLYIQDEWIETFFNDDSFDDKGLLKSAVHVLLPSSEKVKSLEEAVLDKERVHLDPEIKGIYC